MDMSLTVEAQKITETNMTDVLEGTWSTGKSLMTVVA